LNAASDASNSADKPSTANNTCVAQPSEMPIAASSPARCPRDTLCPTISMVSGPGVTLSTITANTKSQGFEIAAIPTPNRQPVPDEDGTV